ncbi:nucleotidyltransferase family protein [Methylophilus sp. UBA6697]|jgi:molybdenum cofactor cytidylyltransferase|uniref:nucleotidyltransferase family protein n=1 Tax=Methylophilus sp. UBA6697 TaxID=1946902 RepID=UPI0025F9F651|nr:nucleotidyltransferase family protein [Methylophilus sp. UBA6697]
MAHPDPRPPLIAGILLAGGFSRRFGTQNKLLQPLADGQLVALRAAQALIAALPHSVAVIRANQPTLGNQLTSLGFKVIECEDQHQQMSDSLKLGLMATKNAFPAMTGLVIALADMPFIQAETIQQVAQQLIQARIVQPMYHGQPGHPVGFRSDLIPDLLAIEGDQGARDVLRAHQADILRFECQDAGILRDIDTPADLA